jgi:hypothetical protein
LLYHYAWNSRELLHLAILCRDLFGKCPAAPFPLEGGVKPSEDKDRHGNWITEAKRRLAAKRGKKPDTKAAQIWALWPEIKLAVAEGQRLVTICAWLFEEADIKISPNTLSSYMARCRRRDSLCCTLPCIDSGVKRSTGHDPMAPARRALEKPRFDIRQIHGNGDPSERNLI